MTAAAGGGAGPVPVPRGGQQARLGRCPRSWESSEPPQPVRQRGALVAVPPRFRDPLQGGWRSRCGLRVRAGALTLGDPDGSWAPSAAPPGACARLSPSLLPTWAGGPLVALSDRDEAVVL